MKWHVDIDILKSREEQLLNVKFTEHLQNNFNLYFKLQISDDMKINNVEQCISC